MARPLRPVETHSSSGHRQSKSQGGKGIEYADREDVFDGEDRMLESDPIATRRVGSTGNDASIVAENERLKRT